MANGQIDPDARFKRLREQAKQEATASTQAQKEALKRRFAQAGMLSSGAAIKQEQLAEKRGQSALSRRLADIEGAQESEALRRQEIEKGREFAAGQAEKQRVFQAGQAGVGRQFAAEQAKLGRAFQAEQAGLGREFQTGERQAGQEFAAGQAEISRDQQQRILKIQQDFAAGQADLARKVQTGQFDEQMTFAREQFEEDKRVTDFNKNLAEAEAGKKSIFDNIGQLGTDAWKGIEMGGSAISLGGIF